jgi:predicted metal-binding protein
MTPEERLDRIERLLQTTAEHIDKHDAAIRSLIVVGRTCLDSIKDMRESHEADYKKLLEAQTATEEKLNILIDTVDRIIRRENHPPQ